LRSLRTLVGENVDSVHVVFSLPKEILPANDFEVEVIAPRGKDSLQQAAKVSFKDLVTPVLVGVNPPGRLAKKKVMTMTMLWQAPRRGAHGIASSFGPIS
jgi:hypothetical protein